jgi:hypothetical protein
MDVSTWYPGRRRITPPPLWMLSDGYRTVGPITTTALVHQVKEGRVPDACGAKPAPSAKWRPLDRIREVRAVRRSMMRGRRPLGSEIDLDASRLMLRLSGGHEALDVGLRTAALELSAELGFVHVFESSHRAVTRYAFGPGARGRIGCPLLERDILSHVARTHSLAMGDVDTHHAFRVAASRLGGRAAEVRGVAMIPIVHGGGVVAMLELGRSERSFRTSDATTLRSVAGRIVDRLVVE